MTANMWKTTRVAIVFLCIILPLTAVAIAEESYPSYDEMTQETLALATRYPRYATISRYGTSVEGRTLYAVRIAMPDGKKRPEAFVASTIHGNEWIANRMAMAVAERLLSGIETDPWITSLMGKTDIWVLPCLNPDGYVATELERGKLAPTRKTRHNAHGVDLNRNFPLPGPRSMNIEMAGSTDPDSDYFMGNEPYSEPETQAIRDFVAAHRFYASIDIHSNWGTVFPARCPDMTCQRLYKEMFKPALAHQKRIYALGMAPAMDSFTGEMEDAMYYDFGILSACWEVSFLADGKADFAATNDWFNQLNPIAITPWIDNDRDSIILAIEKALDLTKGEPVGIEHRKWKGK